MSDLRADLEASATRRVCAWGIYTYRRSAPAREQFGSPAVSCPPGAPGNLAGVTSFAPNSFTNQAQARNPAMASTELRLASLRYLWSSASQHMATPELSRVLLLELDRRAAAHDETPIPAKARQRCCGKCFLPLAPGFNARATQVKHPRRPAARRWSLHVQCQACGHANIFAMATPASSRATSLPSSAPPAPAKPSKGRKPTVPQSVKSKRPKREAAPPATASTSAAEASSFFGFDFVPLT